MANIGVNAVLQTALPTYWDPTILAKFGLSDGTTYAQLVADIQQGLNLAAQRVLSDPLNASLISVTTDPNIEYGVGVSNGFEIHTEYTEPEAKRGATTGHMLPLDKFDRGLGWTWDFLRDARPVQIDQDIASAIADYENLWQQKILSRLFKSTYTAVGSAGRSMPLADGGTADTLYVPFPRPDRAAAFLNTHDHIHHYTATTQANLETVVKHLWEHGYNAPFDLLVSQADLATWTATGTITGFKPAANPLIQYGQDTTLATVNGAEYLGVVDTAYGSVRMRATGRLATTYWAVYKSFGPLDPRNPLVVRVGKEFGSSPVLLPSTAAQNNPLQKARIFVEMGVGVKDRVAAYAAKTDASAYADPTVG